MGRLTRAAQAVKEYFKSFSESNIRDGLIVGVGLGILLLCTYFPKEWIALTLAVVGLGPNIAVLFFGAFAPTSGGVASYCTVVIVVSMILTAVGYPIVLFVTVAAVPDLEPGTKKAVVEITLMAIVVFFYHILRKRIPPLDAPAKMAQVLIACFMLLSYWVPTKGLPWVAIWHIIVFIMMSMAMGLLLTWIIIPTPTGKVARGVFALLLMKVSALSKATSALLQKPVDQRTGRFEAAGDAEDGKYMGIAKGLEADMIELYSMDQETSECKLPGVVGCMHFCHEAHGHIKLSFLCAPILRLRAYCEY